MFSQYKTAGIVAVIAVLALAAGWFKAKSDRLSLELDNVEYLLEVSEVQLKRANEISVKHFADYQAQLEINGALVRESNRKSAEINKFKNREDVVYKKPGLVEKLEQKALDKFFDEVAND